MANKDSLQSLFLLSDEPIENYSDDFLTRDDDARTIAGAVLGTTGPFSIGIYGQWGTGKTSLLNQVRSLLDATDPDRPKLRQFPYVVTASFNAWQHEKDPYPLAHLVEAVDDAITKRLAEVTTVAGKVSEKAVEWLRSAHLAARSLIYSASIELKAAPASPGFKVTAKDAIDRYERLQGEAADPNSRVWRNHIKQSVPRAALRGFRTNHALLDKVRPGEERRIPRIVIFIDDMDRCLPEDAFHLLQSIKLALSQPGFIFVMTLDPEALQPFIESKVNSAGSNAGGGSKAIYLDKMVQLPYSLRLHESQFAGFVDKIVNVRLKAMLPPSQWEVFTSMTKALEVSSQKNPRTLIRRINALLVDARVAPQAIKNRLIDDQEILALLEGGEKEYKGTADEAMHRIDDCQANAEAVFMGLCLIRHTLRQFLGESYTSQLSKAEPLCTLIAERGLTACYKRWNAVTTGNLGAERTTPARPGETPGNEPGDTELMQGRELLQELNRRPWLDELFKTEAGKRWLAAKDDRDLVETFYAKRPEEKTETRPRSTTPAAEQSPKPEPVAAGKGSVAATGQLEAAERERIERAIRGELDLPADAPLGFEQMATVRSLNLRGEPITDAGAAWLASKETGLSALTTLDLSDTQVTDAGVAALAAKDTALSHLSVLKLSHTQVTDAGAKALAAKDTGLTALTELYLGRTQVTDAGVAALAAKGTGLGFLKLLDLSGLAMTDSGIKSLAAKDTGLTALTKLYLGGTQVTDEGIKLLAAKETGLTALNELYLGGMQVTDAGIKLLAAKDAGLNKLTVLFLGGMKVSDEGAAALAAKDTALSALTELYLGGTKVTDTGAKALAAWDTGLASLRVLDLGGTNLTDLAVAALAAKDTGLSSLTQLHLANTKVTDTGARALAAKDTGLASLRALDLSGTSVTIAGITAIEQRLPMSSVYL